MAFLLFPKSTNGLSPFQKGRCQKRVEWGGFQTKTFSADGVNFARFPRQRRDVFAERKVTRKTETPFRNQTKVFLKHGKHFPLPSSATDRTHLRMDKKSKKNVRGEFRTRSGSCILQLWTFFRKHQTTGTFSNRFTKNAKRKCLFTLTA